MGSPFRGPDPTSEDQRGVTGLLIDFKARLLAGLNPAVAGGIASEVYAGVTQLATQAEALAATIATKALSPKNALALITQQIALTAPLSGTVRMTAATATPSGWLTCDGSSVLRTDYPSLFAAIGTTYGSADSTHFSLPNLADRVPIGSGGSISAGTLGATGGEAAHTLSVNEMPSHAHVQNAHGHGVSDPGHAHGTYIGQVDDSNWTGWNSGNQWPPADGPGQYNGPITQASGANLTIQTTTPTEQNAGGGASHNILQPYVVLRYLVKT